MPAKVCVTTAGRGAWNSFAIVQRFVQSGLADHYTLTPDPAGADLHIHVGTPESSQEHYFDSAARRFAFYTFAESTRVPDRWRAWFDRADQVWIPSRFVGEVLTNCGVSSPLAYVPLGVPTPAERFLCRSGAAGPFTILWQGSRLRAYRDGVEIDGDRKGGRVVEAAFRMAAIPNSRLVLKYLPSDPFEYDIETDNVRYICRALPRDDLAELDRDVDVFCWPTMGEGFGLPPLEKLVRGIPALTTALSGMMDYLDDFATPRIVPDGLVDVRFNGVEARMANVEPQSLAALLTDCAARRDELWASRPALAASAERWTLETRMWPAVRAAVESML